MHKGIEKMKILWRTVHGMYENLARIMCDYLGWEVMQSYIHPSTKGHLAIPTVIYTVKPG